MTLLLASVWGGSALAAEADDSYMLFFAEINKKIPIGVMTKAECVATIETAFNPEETIVAGLNTLDAGKNQSPTQSCLTELVSGMNSDTLSGSNFKEVPTLEPGKFAGHLAEVKQKKKCYNPNKPGSYSYNDYQTYNAKTCEGKWLDEEDGKKAEAEYKELNRFRSLFQSLIGAIVDQHQELQKEISTLDDKIDTCGPNPYSKDSYQYKSYEKDRAKQCKHVFSESEIKVMKKKLAELNEKYGKLNSESDKLQGKIQGAIYSGSYVADGIFDRRKELTPLARAVVCTSPYEPGSSDDKYWKADKKEDGYCGDSFGKKSDLPKARAKFLAALGDLEKLTAKNKADYDEAVKQYNLKLLALTGDQTKRYVYRRLFANYKGYYDRKGKEGSVDEFCANYELEGLRDARFSRSKILGEDGVSIHAFSDAKGWLHAQYGLTEAEYKAMSMYVGSFYHQINEPLWKHVPLSPELTLYKELLDAGLKKLPTLPGGIPLKRHLTLPQAAIDAHKLGEIITYDSYTSTSKNPNWNWGGNAKMIIYGGKNSKDVSKFNEGEQEVIFLPGTGFKVIGKETSGGTTNFVLGEVDEKGDLVARLPAPKDWTP